MADAADVDVGGERVVLQERKRLSESVIWELQDAFYKDINIRSWSDRCVRRLRVIGGGDGTLLRIASPPRWQWRCDCSCFVRPSTRRHAAYLSLPRWRTLLPCSHAIPPQRTPTHATPTHYHTARPHARQRHSPH